MTEGIVAAALLGWIIIELAGPIHHPPMLTALLMCAVYLSLAALAGHAIGKAVRD